MNNKTQQPDDEPTTVVNQDMDDLSLDLIEVKVKLNGKPHVIVSADSDTATEYRNISLKHVIMRDAKIEGKLMGLAESEPYLVSRCVFMIDADGNRHPYSLDAVKSWNSSAVKKLYNKIRDISDLEEKAADTAKN